MQEGKEQGLGTIAGISDTYWGKNKGRSIEGALVKVTTAVAGGVYRTVGYFESELLRRLFPGFCAKEFGPCVYFGVFDRYLLSSNERKGWKGCCGNPILCVFKHRRMDFCSGFFM